MENLTIEVIEQARTKILENATELVEESEMLFGHQRFARSFALARLSLEEMVKLPMLVRVGCELATGNAVDARKLRKRLNSHKEKIRMVHMLDYFQSEIRADDSDLRDLESNRSFPAVLPPA